MRENARPRPVGTRGGVEWMRGPCACPRWGAAWLLHTVPHGSRCHEDSTRPPPCPTSAPCPYRTPFGRQHSSGIQINLSKCIIGTYGYPGYLLKTHYRLSVDVMMSAFKSYSA